MLNKTFIKDQFKNIKEQYNLNWQGETDHRMTIENESLAIYFGKDPRESGMLISVTDKARNEFYFSKDLLRRKGYQKFSEIFNQKEGEVIMELDDDEALVTMLKILLEKHCQDVLSGDFSNVGPGRKKIGAM
ncbi:MAG: hypothetical protein H6581_27210 [Bacteroidia bacterium]|nr:hypothetical protein [Bacteroidia bacterium]